MKEHHVKPHRCSHPGCDRSFDRPYRLALHLSTHSNVGSVRQDGKRNPYRIPFVDLSVCQDIIPRERVEKAFTCSEDGCSKSYTNKSHLDRHIKSSHNQSEKVVVYSCTKCPNVYANRQNLKRHMKTAHTLKPKIFWSCDICKVDFPKKHYLNSHMYEHTGVMPFSCEECHKEFVTLHDKRRHIRFHKTHTCTECGLKFNHWSKFKEHTRMHQANKEYICNECGRKFKQRVHIVRHIKIHASRKFPCPYENCKRSYSRNSNLNQHILMKHENVCHKCEICNAELCTKAKLRDHMMILHSGIPRNKPKPKAGPRRRRKDAGIPKTSTAQKLAGIGMTLQKLEVISI